MEKIDYLSGQFKALLNLTEVLIASHPAPGVLLTQFEASTRNPPDSPEDLSVSQAFLDGLTEVNQHYAQLIRRATERT
jgi:hypothetical protein